MKVVKWRMSIGYPGAERTGEVQVPEDATEKEIEAEVREDAFNFLEFSWDVAST